MTVVSGARNLSSSSHALLSQFLGEYTEEKVVEQAGAGDHIIQTTFS